MDLDYTLPNLRDLLARSREGLRRIQQIVTDLRHFARLDNVDIQDQEDEVDINAGIVSTLNIIEAQARTKQVRIERELSPRLPPLRGSGAKINQVVMNLVANALDSCGPGGTVTVRTVYDDQADPDTVRIEVSDTGAGIEPAVQERIFDPFFTTKPPGVGTGLGLSISYGIVRDHGGTITVVSAPGQGAHLTVRLPLRRPAGADDSVGGSSGDSDSGSAALS
jgi:signal transduction histidine kinase